MENQEHRPFRIGIIYNGTNAEDILAYKKDFQKINELSKGNISLVFMGVNPDEDLSFGNFDDVNEMLDGLEYEYVPPVSIVHYFKQLQSNQLDLLFIPLINNDYNATSEDYNKYLETSLFKIPVMVQNMYPYNRVIQNQVNGFLYEKQEEFVDYLMHVLTENQALLSHCALTAYNDVTQKFNFSKQNIEWLENIILDEQKKS